MSGYKRRGEVLDGRIVSSERYNEVVCLPTKGVGGGCRGMIMRLGLARWRRLVYGVSKVTSRCI